MLSRALELAKREGGKKVSINFQVPVELKEKLDQLCKSNGVSLTSMLNGLVETAIEESKGIQSQISAESLLQINNRINEIDNKLSEYCSYVGGSLTSNPGMSPDEHIHMTDLESERARLVKIFDLLPEKNEGEIE